MPSYGIFRASTGSRSTAQLKAEIMGYGVPYTNLENKEKAVIEYQWIPKEHRDMIERLFIEGLDIRIFSRSDTGILKHFVQRGHRFDWSDNFYSIESSNAERISDTTIEF